MHALSHSLAHRPPPATRTGVRWQPYNSFPSSSRSTPNSTFLITPSPSVSSPPQSSKLCDLERIRRPSISSIHPSLRIDSSSSSHSRDGSRSRYVIGLVDQAVKSLGEIWQPQHIPEVFVTSSRVTVTVTPPKHPSRRRSLTRQFRNEQLPSPESPNTQQSSFSSPSPLGHHHSPPSSSSSSSCHSTNSASNLVPLKGFVHEVLRRSRTSGTVLQTALCYLEAIRQKVPELAQKEKVGKGSSSDSEERIVLLDDEEIVPPGTDSTGTQMSLASVIHTEICTSTPPVDFDDNSMDVSQVLPNPEGSAFVISNTSPPLSRSSSAGEPAIMEIFSKKHKTPSGPLPPLPPLPSPLLCPRRAFLASLILASKFTQDRCYSNKAWAKLSGLPPREIGRCERALGDALEWRLWVGKVPAGLLAVPASSSASLSGRAVGRCRSEGDLFPQSGVKPSRTLTRKDECHPPVDTSRHQPAVGDPPFDPSFGFSQGNGEALSQSKEAITTTRSSTALRRCSTLPASTWDQSEITRPRSNADSSQSTTSSSRTQEFAQVVAESFVQQWEYTYQSRSGSSSPSTPSLTFSPESVESNSDGDRTIQFSSFIDVPTPPTCFASETRKHLTVDGDSPPFVTAPTVDYHYPPLDSNSTIYSKAAVKHGIFVPFSHRDDIKLMYSC